MGRSGPFRLRDERAKIVVDPLCVVGPRESQPLRYTDDVGVHGEGWNSEGVSEDDVGRLAAYARQRRQLVDGSRHLAAVALAEGPAHPDERARLGFEEARRMDLPLE